MAQLPAALSRHPLLLVTLRGKARTTDRKVPVQETQILSMRHIDAEKKYMRTMSLMCSDWP